MVHSIMSQSSVSIVHDQQQDCKHFPATMEDQAAGDLRTQWPAMFFVVYSTVFRVVIRVIIWITGAGDH